MPIYRNLNNNYVNLSGTQTVTGAKTFASGLTTDVIAGANFVADATTAVYKGNAIYHAGNLAPANFTTKPWGNTSFDGTRRVYRNDVNTDEFLTVVDAPSLSGVRLTTNTNRPTAVGIADSLSPTSNAGSTFIGGLRGKAIQWSTSVVSIDANGYGSLAFPRAFPVACLIVIPVCGDHATWSDRIISVAAKSRTGFTFRLLPSPGATAYRVDWIAVGE